MQLYNLAQRPLTKAEEKTIAHFRYYYDQKRCFALLAEGVAAVLSDEYSGDPEKLRQEAQENMTALLNYPPDFTTYVMDDRFGLVSMEYGIYGVSAAPLSAEEIESEQMDVGSALTVRSACLAACEAKELIAIVDEALSPPPQGTNLP